MNLQPTTPQPGETPDADLDALLDEALAVGDVPADLQDRVLALTDPAFNAQLDQALAPQAMPDGLQQRVMQRVNETLDEQARPVLATIGRAPRVWVGYAAAAAIVLATGVSFYFVASNVTTPTNSTVVDNNPIDTDTGINDFEDALAFADETEMDQRLSSLESRILSVSGESIWGSDSDFQRELWLELSPEGEGLLF